jgi:hypothetical protein
VRILAALVLAASILGGEQGLTAGNAVAGGPAGSGSAEISGYVVADVEYGVDEERIASVSFRLEPGEAGSVQIRLSPGGAWHPCDVVDGTAECVTPNETVAAASALEVVAAS